LYREPAGLGISLLPYASADYNYLTFHKDLISSPRWAPDGRELLYLTGKNELMAVTVKTAPALSLGTPRVLFESKYVSDQATEGTVWDFHPDGKRFLMMRSPGTNIEGAATGSSRKINIVTHWFEELKERVPVP